MSFIGLIEYIMQGLGLQALFELIYLEHIHCSTPYSKQSYLSTT